jgi:hypothetical protein
VQSVTYNIADPDDGSCEECQDESCCLSLKSSLNSRVHRCHWNPTDASTLEGSCHFRDIGHDLTRTVIVALISAIVSAPFALSMQYVVLNVLSKTTRDAKKQNQTEISILERLKSHRQVLNVQSESTIAEQSGRSVEEDLHNLLRELSEYYANLINRESRSKCEDFRCESLFCSSPLCLADAASPLPL